MGTSSLLSPSPCLLHFPPPPPLPLLPPPSLALFFPLAPLNSWLGLSAYKSTNQASMHKALLDPLTRTFNELGVILRVNILDSYFIMTGDEILTYEERCGPMVGPWLWGSQSVPGTPMAFRPHLRAPGGNDGSVLLGS